MKVFALLFPEMNFISISVHIMEAFLELIAISLKVKDLLVYGVFGFGIGTFFGKIGS